MQFVGVDVDVLLELNDYFATLTAAIGRFEDLVGGARHEAVEQLARRQPDSVSLELVAWPDGISSVSPARSTAIVSARSSTIAQGSVPRALLISAAGEC